MEAREEMIGVDKSDDIGRLGWNGKGTASIACGAGVFKPTVRKWPRESNLFERPPAVGRVPESSLAEPFTGLIDLWLLKDGYCQLERRI